jgi:hypothetical protein
MIKKDEPIEQSTTPDSPAILDYVNPSGADSVRRNRVHPVLTFVVVGVGLLVLISVLLPSMGRAREPANRIKCASNLRQISQAILIYAQANGDMPPPSFDLALETVNISPEVFVCPSSTDERATGPTTRALIQNFHQPGSCSYIYALPGNLSMSLIGPQHVVAYEPIHNHQKVDGVDPGINVLYGDGTVTWLNEAKGKHVIAELQAGHNPPRPRGTSPGGN